MRRKSVPLLRPGYFLWLIIPAALYGAATQIGLPHIIFSYHYTAPPGRHYDPTAFGLRVYHSCRYWGPYGHGFVDSDAPDDRCPMFRFFKPGAPQ